MIGKERRQKKEGQKSRRAEVKKSRYSKPKSVVQPRLQKSSRNVKTSEVWQSIPVHDYFRTAISLFCSS
jgi:hypothetical protein